MFTVLFILCWCLSMTIVILAFRTDVCVKEHEEFSLCSWRCPPTCVNMRLLSQPGIYCPYRWECRVGCRCSAGYIRDEYSKHCVEVNNCPEYDHCPKGQVLGINLQCIERRHSIVSDMGHWVDYPDMDTPWPHYYKRHKKNTKPPLKLHKKVTHDPNATDISDHASVSNETDYEESGNEINSDINDTEKGKDNSNPESKKKLKFIRNAKGENNLKKILNVRLGSKKDTESKWVPGKYKLKLTNITKSTRQEKIRKVSMKTSKTVDTKWKPTKKKSTQRKTKTTSTKKEKSIEYIIESSDIGDTKWKPTKKRKTKIPKETQSGLKKRKTIIPKETQSGLNDITKPGIYKGFKWMEKKGIK